MKNLKKKLLVIVASVAMAVPLAACGQPPAPTKATVTVVNGTGGGTYDIGSSATVTAVVPEYKTFKEWQSNDTTVSITNPYTFTVVKDITLTAVFNTKQVSITVTNGTGGGIFDAGTTVTVKPTLDDGDTFKSWKVNGETVSTEQNYTFIAKESITLVADIDKAPSATVTVINGTGGGTYKVGKTATVTPTLEEGDTFVSWNIGDQVVSTSAIYSFTVTEDVTLTAIIKSEIPMSKYTQNIHMSGDSFKILNFTDTQLHNGNDLTLTKHIIDTLIKEVEPDMITLLGDILNDDTTYDADQVALETIQFIDSYDIPWAPIFGNHDNFEYHPEGTKKSVGVEYLMELFEDCDNCLFLEGPSDVLGKSNYLVNVLNSKDEIVESLVFLDSYTHGVQESNALFYEAAMTYAKELNDDVMPKSVVFDHIPVLEYATSYSASEDIELHDMVGVPGSDPLSAGTHDLFNSIKRLGSTKTMICGHDHESAHYTVYEGVTLAYAMKSSDGDDADGNSFTHPLGGLLLTIDGIEDKLEYKRVEDISYSFTSSFVYHPEPVSYWRHSGAKLVFDIELPNSGSFKFNVEGTNLLRSSVSPELRKGGWNRLTEDITIDAGAKSASKGTLTLIENNKYHYEIDVTAFAINSGEDANGDETARLVYFHSASGGKYTITNIHYEFENITETDQVDLATATIADIGDIYFNDLPVRPDPTVKINGTPLVKGTDIIYTYENNQALGTATVTVIPSGKGAHRYKGQISKTFNIIKNPDDDTLPGHENAIKIDSNGVTLSSSDKNFVSINDWYNSGKLLHLELKRLAAGSVKEGETIRFSLMGSNENPDAKEKGNTWSRFTIYYILDFSDSNVVCRTTDVSPTIIATGKSLGDGWFSLDIDFKDMSLNSSEGVHGNDKETMCRVYFDNLKRSFKIDKISLIDKQ